MTRNRTIFIGDVHGCIDELQELLDRVRPPTLWSGAIEHHIVFVGDLVDRGPDSIGVLKLVEALVKKGEATCIAGNHEEKALRHHKRGTTDAWGESWVRDPDVPWDFIEAMPLIHRIPELGALVVHGGLFPGYFEKHGEIGEPKEPWHKGGGKRMDRMRRFLRIRHIKLDDGSMVKFGDEGPKTQHWTEWYDGREGFVVYGHDPQLKGEVRMTPHSIGLDTACVFGACLTACIVNGNVPASMWAPRFEKVPAKELYADPIEQD